MKFSIYNQFAAKNSSPVLTALAQGLGRHGHSVCYHDDSADVAVIWSVLWHGNMLANQQVWNCYRNSGRDVMVIEVGVIERNRTWRVGINGANAAGYHGPIGNGPERARLLGLKLQDWKHLGDHVMICTQHPASDQWSGMPHMDQWLDQTIKTVRRYSDRPVVVRPHPRSKITPRSDVKICWPKKIHGSYDSFDFAVHLTDTWAVLNWSSNPAIESVLQGVPAFVGPDSLAAPVANLDWSKIDCPDRPDRTQWLNDLAYCEWTVEEIQHGMPLERLFQSALSK